MSDTVYSFHSSRAQKARMARAITPWVVVCQVAAVVLLVAGLGLVFLGWSIGWAAMGVAFLLGMIAEWYRGELQSLVVGTADTIDELLEAEVLAQLPANPSPVDIATALATTKGGIFFAARFGVGGGFLQQLVSSSSQDTPAVWQEALHIRKQLNLTSISAGVLITALIRQLPEEVTLLARLQLDDNALIDGIKWYDHLQTLIDRHSKGGYSKPGGIGRDWSFGWIPLLSRFGHNISEGSDGSGARLLQLESHRDALDQLLKRLETDGTRSLALVGKTGVGKTEVVYTLADMLMDPRGSVSPQLKYHQVFLLDAASIVSAAPGRGELEEAVVTILNEAYAAKNIIICLDNAQSFFEDGVGSVDLAPVLLPILQAGRLPIIMTMDEQRYLQITSRNPEVGNAMTRINIEPATAPETMAVLQDKLITVEFQNNVTYMYQALKEAYRLSERYVQDLAMPGRAVRLMELSAQYAENGLVTARSVQQAIEKSVGVKIGPANDEQEREKLLNLEALIHERMIGQERAVAVVSDALRRARAGVRNQSRPIGTFLFLGPTGVGKTELAKSLASVYFGDERQMIRFDMNEFVSPYDVQRLIADGANDAGSLTAQVMKQPFSVILLDELEKAHDSVLTTLLQLLDEGILRDEKNREVSFRDAIVIATSNAGADRIREFVQRGVALESVQESIVDDLINSNAFRPEFLNRFDEIVVFGPLGQSELLQVTDLIIEGINKTLEPQKISVQVDDDAKRYLVEAGYDPRLGARPMRRVIQKTVENLTAKAMLGQQLEAGESLRITLSDVKAVLDAATTADQMIES